MPEFLETTIDKFIFKAATDRLYSAPGIWVQAEADGRVRLGLTDYQQQLNGDVAFVHAKPVGTTLATDEEFVEVETIKATTGFPSPVAGRIAELNGQLDRYPETVNQDPYGAGWLVLIAPANWPADRAKLLDAAAYLAATRSQAEEELQK